MHHSKSLSEQITYAFRNVLSRIPQESDLVHLQNAMQKQFAFFYDDPIAAKAFVEVGNASRDKELDLTTHEIGRAHV